MLAPDRGGARDAHLLTATDKKATQLLVSPMRDAAVFGLPSEMRMSVLDDTWLQSTYLRSSAWRSMTWIMSKGTLQVVTG